MEKFEGLNVPKCSVEELRNMKTSDIDCGAKAAWCPSGGCQNCLASYREKKEKYLLKMKGGNEVEFKVGDRVECINNRDIDNGRIADAPYLTEGEVYTITGIKGPQLALEGIGPYWPYVERFKLANKSNQQIKEEVMKDNNTDKNVTEVFGDLPHNEVVIIDKHFDDEMLKVILMNKFSKEIKKACVDAEDKLKEEEAKE